MPTPLRPLRGREESRTTIRGYRFAQPPANGCHPSGVKSGNLRMCREWQTRGPIACRVVRHERHLVDLAAKWDELLAASPRPEAMLSPDWLTTWWRHYGDGRELAVGVYEAAGQLVGLAPMCSRTFRYRPGINFRRIE